MTFKVYKSSPMPFQGQKRRFINQFIEVIKKNPSKIYVDLFGGSGLLSHVTKSVYPDAKVVFNDYDNFSQRLANIPKTNQLLNDLRTLNIDIKRGEKLNATQRERVLQRINEENGYVDYITLSSSLLFAMQYVKSFDELSKSTMYNKIKMTPYSAVNYLQGIEVVRDDYRKIYETYKSHPDVVFLIDPPYLSTDCSSYENYWRLKDYLDVMLCLYENSYVYFTSNKSNIVELCEWIESNTGGLNPFSGATTQTMRVAPSYNSSFTDMMIYKFV
ncbi:MAG: DNA adenine methylase [Bacteroidales bacterium]|nr:DNA adenine methylase [Bacteroidales bacterium]